MAKQDGDLFISGCIGNICFYRLQNGFYARTKSSLTGERVKKDPAFKKTMEYASKMAKASQISSAVYQSLPNEKKERKIYQQLTGIAIRMLRDGLKDEEVYRKLKKIKGLSW